MSTRYPEIYIDQPCEFVLDCIEDISLATEVKIYAYHASHTEPQELVYLGNEGTTKVRARRLAPIMQPAGLWRVQPKVWFSDGFDEGYPGRPLAVLVREEGTP